MSSSKHLGTASVIIKPLAMPYGQASTFVSSCQNVHLILTTPRIGSSSPTQPSAINYKAILLDSCPVIMTGHIGVVKNV